MAHVLNTHTQRRGSGKPIGVPAFLRATKGPRAKRSLSALASQAVGVVGQAFKSLGKVLLLPLGAADSATAFRDARTPYKWTGRRTLVMVPTLALRINMIGLTLHCSPSQAPNISLSLIKAIKDPVGATVNDVLVSALAGAL
jgi:hypothetical protein